jgi:hypothetical protein
MMHRNRPDRGLRRDLLAHRQQPRVLRQPHIALRRMERPQLRPQLLRGQPRILRHAKDRDRERQLQVPHVLQHARPVPRPHPLRDLRDLLRTARHRRAKVDDRRQPRHRRVQVDEPADRPPLHEPPPELMVLQPLPDQVVVLGVQRHQHRLRHARDRIPEQVQLPRDRTPSRRHGHHLAVAWRPVTSNQGYRPLGRSLILGDHRSSSFYSLTGNRSRQDPQRAGEVSRRCLQARPRVAWRAS